jgi:hypothetical protein
VTPTSNKQSVPILHNLFSAVDPDQLDDEQLLAQRSEESARPRFAPLLSTVRFGPGVIAILSLIALIAAAFYFSGHLSFAALFGGLDGLLFAVKSMEIIELGHPVERTLVGRRCIVVSRVQKGKGGLYECMILLVGLILSCGQRSPSMVLLKGKKQWSWAFGLLS